ncbi:MAG: hypothetical protein HXO42_10690 [Prevotella sp.]|uniref:hypothetical protein n=1 Tax=Prevotella sp. TaxID=59823 RepID=UPI001CAE4283|nr:hypothetical protein [Prevotella sp.]MBF1620925.1 hypothetical protein [Prevotella sp.]
MVFLGGHSEIRTGHANAVNPVSNKTIIPANILLAGIFCCAHQGRNHAYPVVISYSPLSSLVFLHGINFIHTIAEYQLCKQPLKQSAQF